MHQLYICIAHQHDRSMLLLAAVICALGAYATVLLSRQAATIDPRQRWRWIVATVLASTSAIWATHFVAMLAFRVSMPYGFEPGFTVASFFVALLLTGIATWTAIARRGRHAVLLGGAIAGIAISAMHYVGMAAFRVVGTIAWDPGAVVASIVVGMAFAAAAFAMSLRARALNAAIPAAFFTVAICGDHLIAMSAATIAYDPRVALPPGLFADQALSFVVGAIAVFLIGMTLVAHSMHRKALRRDAAERQQLQQLSDVAVEGLLICEESRIVWVNRSLEMLLPGTRDDHVGKSIDALIQVEVDSLGDLAANIEVDARLRIGDHAAPVRIIMRPLRIEGRPHRVFAVRDQRERLHAEAEMRRLATTDTLTGLANRARFNVVLQRMLEAPQPRGGNFALLSLDLDRFKSVNDSYGHAAGDSVLREVAARLNELVRDGDLVARLGGDEFCVLAATGGDHAAMRRVAERIIESVARPFAIDGREHEISVSIGIAFAMTDAIDAEALAISADLALYRAKEDGRGRYRMFEPAMSTRMQERNALEQALRHALSRDELRVHYQPLVDARSGVVCGAEALVRWEHPQRGLVPPSDFIPLAEETNLIGAIGGWVLRTACREAATWPAHLSIAVNLSPAQFRDPALPAIVASALESAGLPGARLELEITESVLIDDAVRVHAALDQMKRLGIRISLDDFGTGYSSLGHLRRFPFDKIKIDRSFTARVNDDRESAAIVRAIASLGASLGLKITAEGVENEDQRWFVVEAGCDQIQGYLFGRPVPVEALPAAFRDVGMVEGVGRVAEGMAV